MATKLGNKRRCYIGTTKTGTWVWLKGEQSNNFNLSANQVETSDKSNDWQSFIYGIKGATASVTVFTDNADATQKQAIAALMNSTNVFVFIGELNGSAIKEGDVFEALVTSVGETNDNGSVSTRDISLVATGEVTHTDEASA